MICGDDWAAFRLARYCQQRGFYVQAIPHPVVPKGTARLRVSITAGHDKEQLDQFATVLDQGLDELAIPRDVGGRGGRALEAEFCEELSRPRPNPPAVGLTA